MEALIDCLKLLSVGLFPGFLLGLGVVLLNLSQVLGGYRPASWKAVWKNSVTTLFACTLYQFEEGKVDDSLEGWHKEA